MKRPHGNRARLGGVLLAVALGAAAVLALPGLGIGKSHNGARAAGTIESFNPETGQLVIDLTKGGTIEGLVVRRTKIRCGEHRRGHRRRHRGHGNGSASALRRDSRGAENEGEDAGDRKGHGDGGPRSDDASGDDRRRHGEDHSARCIDHLVEGAVVKRAEMVLAHGNAFYKKIGVLPPKPAASE